MRPRFHNSSAAELLQLPFGCLILDWGLGTTLGFSGNITYLPSQVGFPPGHQQDKWHTSEAPAGGQAPGQPCRAQGVLVAASRLSQPRAKEAAPPRNFRAPIPW